MILLVALALAQSPVVDSALPGRSAAVSITLTLTIEPTVSLNTSDVPAGAFVTAYLSDTGERILVYTPWDDHPGPIPDPPRTDGVVAVEPRQRGDGQPQMPRASTQ